MKLKKKIIKNILKWEVFLKITFSWDNNEHIKKECIYIYFGDPSNYYILYIYIRKCTVHWRPSSQCGDCRIFFHCFLEVMLSLYLHTSVFTTGVCYLLYIYLFKQDNIYLNEPLQNEYTIIGPQSNTFIILISH